MTDSEAPSSSEPADSEAPSSSELLTEAPGSGTASLAELTELLADLEPRLTGSSEVRVSGITQDSRRVLPGDLFVAREGLRQSGLAHVADAAARGAAGVLTDARGALSLPLPVLQVSHARLALGRVAEQLLGWPSRQLPLVGITGTNGKTTTAWLCQRAFEEAGVRTARLGTLGFSLGDELTPSPLTTPEGDQVSHYLARALKSGARAFVMEASSHALEQRRIDALTFRVGVFTNLSQDHLDYHPTLAAYAEAKERLFFELSPELGVIHVGDAHGAGLAARLRSAGRQVLTVGRAEGADIRLVSSRVTARGTEGVLTVLGESHPLVTPLVGEHNLENLLCTLGVSVGLARCVRPGELAPELAQLLEALRLVGSAPGRLERCDGPEDDVTVLVDYAHTPDALRRVLVAARGLLNEAGGSGQLTCVFGCGGDRDPMKRPLMGEVVARAADRAIVTNDNPRSESPQAIADMILPGFEAHAMRPEVILDRALAITTALREAAPGDVVLIAGKGHEPYQLIGDQVLSFDDRAEARAALAERRARRQASSKDAP
ncbi:MAG: UDP-N-acetylmuramoyl-L-alanyl-D-glutamate--2,6-diaminopimelate ligase [Labilithrix sp.]|nr:UDP-N-acetylmuramoyl-L-alanyl-D-glutamate--2,6-diaminopimelate ligase [Labilithrix sp.]